VIELSPATQAVLDAYINAPCGKSRGVWVAAALRAAADQVVPDHANSVGDAHDDARRDQWMRIRRKLLTIAAELEGGGWQ
jgi:hypothetical protein